MFSAKTKVLVLLLVHCFLGAYAQEHALVRGRVTDTKKVPVEYATVVLKGSAGGTVLATGVTDDKGNFSLELPAKRSQEAAYVVEVHHLLYEAYASAHLSGQDLVRQALPVILADKAHLLGPVTIEGKKPLLEREGNTLRYNISGQEQLKGRNLSDILRNLPGVTLPPTGTLQVFGRGGVAVFLNEDIKPLDGKELQAFLSSMDHSIIESIEITPTASAETDAGFTSVIRIRTKTKVPGLYSSQTVRYEQAIRPGLHVSSFTTTPLKGSDFNFFASYANTRKFEFNEYRRLAADRYYVQETEHRIQPQVIVVEPTLRHLFSNKSQLVVYGKFGWIDERIKTAGHSRGSGFGELQNRNNTKNHSDKLTTGLFYGLPLPSDGQVKRRLQLALDYSYNNLPSRYTNFSEFSSSEAEEKEPYFAIQTAPDALLRLQVGKADFVEERKKATYKLGAKATRISYDNRFDINPLLNSSWVLDSLDFARYQYREQTYAAYATLTLKPFKRVDATIGLRAEHSRLENGFDTKPASLDTSYLQFFPSLNLAYTFENGNVLGYNLTRRINRPNFNQLNPTLFLVDPFTYLRGCETLLPQLTTLHEFFFILDKKSVFSLSHTYTDQFMAQFPFQQGAYLELSPRNFSYRRVWALYGSHQANLASWWQLNGDAAISSVSLRFREVKREAGSYRFGLRNNFTLPRSFQANLDFQYTAPGMNGIFEQEPYGVVSAGLRRSFLEQKLHVGLGVQDVFYSQRVRNSYVTAQENMELRQRFNSRLFSLSVNYVFNSAKGKRISKQTDEELQRL